MTLIEIFVLSIVSKVFIVKKQILQKINKAKANT